jgi:hypothetical protein
MGRSKKNSTSIIRKIQKIVNYYVSSTVVITFRITLNIFRATLTFLSAQYCFQLQRMNPNQTATIIFISCCGIYT